MLLSPHYLENVWQIYNVKTKNEKEDETHVTRDRNTSIIYPIPLSRLTYSIVAVL